MLLAALRQLREGREVGLRIEDQIAGLLGVMVVRLHLPDSHAAFRPALIEAHLGVTGMSRAITERIRHRGLDEAIGEHSPARQREGREQGGSGRLIYHGGDVSGH